MKKVTKTSTIRRINDVYSFGVTRILQMMQFKFDAPKSIELYQQSKNEMLSILRELDSEPDMQRHLEEEIQTFESYTPIVYTMAIIYAIAHFEAYLNGLTESLLQFYWKTLKSRNKTLTYEEALNFESIDDLKNSLIKNEMMRFSHMGMNEKIKYYEEKFNVTFKYERIENSIRKNWNCIEKEGLIKVFAQRNIILHNGAVVNEKFLNITQESNTQVGDVIKINKDDALDSIGLLFRVCDSFRQVGINKVQNIVKP